MVFVSLYGVQYGVCEEITCETNEILLIHQTSLFKRERRGDSHCVIANRLKRKQRQRVPASDRHGPCLRVYKTFSNIQTHSENSIRSVRESSCIKACQNCYKHCYITMKLLKSTVTLLNTCEKLKVMHETQCDLGNKPNGKGQ